MPSTSVFIPFKKEELNIFKSELIRLMALELKLLKVQLSIWTELSVSVIRIWLLFSASLLRIVKLLKLI